MVEPNAFIEPFCLSHFGPRFDKNLLSENITNAKYQITEGLLKVAEFTHLTLRGARRFVREKEKELGSLRKTNKTSKDLLTSETYSVFYPLTPFCVESVLDIVNSRKEVRAN